MAGVLLPFLKWFIGGSGTKGPKLLNCVVRSPWSTIDVVGEVRDDGQLLPNSALYFSAPLIRITSLGHNELDFIHSMHR
jgi:hypothetical protein